MAIPDLFTARARRTDPETSVAAAKSVKRIAEAQQLVLDTLLRLGPQTDSQIIASLYGKLSDSGIRTRRHELCQLNKVYDTGLRDTLPSGRKSIVWAAK